MPRQAIFGCKIINFQGIRPYANHDYFETFGNQSKESGVPFHLKNLHLDKFAQDTFKCAT